MARVLVVDDKPSNRELLRTALEFDGHQVFEACDGTSALKSMKELHPDLLLLDIQMPGLDGYGVLSNVLADSELRDIPVIAVTAYAMAGDRERGRQAGFKDYLTKPFSLKTLLSAVKASLGPDKL
jgi:CheY-like chemotaxis protein